MLIKSEELDKLVREEQALMDEIDSIENYSEREEKELELEKKRRERLDKAYEVYNIQKKEKGVRKYTSKSIMTYKDLRSVMNRKYEHRKELRRKVDEFLGELREDLKEGRELMEKLKGKKDFIDDKDKGLKKEVMEW